MPKQLNPCPAKNRRWADNNHTGGLEDLYWGCAHGPVEDKKTENLNAPLLKDSFQIWQRSWAVLRFQANFPGIWQFHCHMEQHIPLGMIMAVNIKPSLQPPIPDSVPTEGPCPVWSKNMNFEKKGEKIGSLRGDNSDVVSKMEKDKLVEENSMLNNRIQELEKQLKRAKADAQCK